MQSPHVVKFLVSFSFTFTSKKETIDQDPSDGIYPNLEILHIYTFLLVDNFINAIWFLPCFSPANDDEKTDKHVCGVSLAPRYLD